jgi:hypothetical protein
MAERTSPPAAPSGSWSPCARSSGAAEEGPQSSYPHATCQQLAGLLVPLDCLGGLHDHGDEAVRVHCTPVSCAMLATTIPQRHVCYRLGLHFLQVLYTLRDPKQEEEEWGSLLGSLSKTRGQMRWSSLVCGLEDLEERILR